MTTTEPPGPPAQASDDDAARRPPSGPRPPLSFRSLLSVAAIGGVTTVVAYLISGGSIPIFVAVIVGLGITARLSARAWLWHIGKDPPRGWWL
jgi:hypothetical protein